MGTEANKTTHFQEQSVLLALPPSAARPIKRVFLLASVPHASKKRLGQKSLRDPVESLQSSPASRRHEQARARSLARCPSRKASLDIYMFPGRPHFGATDLHWVGWFEVRPGPVGRFSERPGARQFGRAFMGVSSNIHVEHWRGRFYDTGPTACDDQLGRLLHFLT
jgi:hypothetical protein